MSVEERLRDALGPGLTWDAPSPDLFARVQQSVGDDRRRRARRRRIVVAALGGTTAVAVLLLLTAELDGDRWLLEWWWLEGLVTVGLSGLVVALGPLIRRFGQVYVSDVFRATPDTGSALLALMDIAYYLVFGAYVVMTITLARPPSWGAYVGADQLWRETARVGGLLLLMGVLHGLNLLTLPVVARLLTLNRTERSPDPPT